MCKGRSNACNPLALRIDKNLGNLMVKKVYVRTLADRRGIRLLSINSLA
jgi:uridine kinase